jgi:hypothetical protein
LGYNSSNGKESSDGSGIFKKKNDSQTDWKALIPTARTTERKSR